MPNLDSAPATKPAGRAFLTDLAPLIAVSLIFLAVAVGIRIRLLQMPLERDEGEYAYAGQLMLQGVPPYREAYNMKWPGTYAAYALIMAVFGQTTEGIHVGLLLVNLATVPLVFLLARRVCGSGAGAVAAATYALFSMSPGVLGLAAHATHFVVLPALAGIVLLQDLGEKTRAWRIFFAGTLLGLATIMKQSGAAFAVFAVFWIVWREVFEASLCNYARVGRRLAWLALGGAAPVAVMGVTLAAAGVFGSFWHWTVQYARAYASETTFDVAKATFTYAISQLWYADPALWVAAILGLFLFFGDHALRRWWPFVAGLTVCSALAVCPGLFFRQHYFVQLLPAAGLLVGIAAYEGLEMLKRMPLNIPPAVIVATAFVAAASYSLFKLRGIYFEAPPVTACRMIYQGNPFAEAVEISRYLETNCPPDARIAVLGSEPEIFFYSHRRSATGYIYTYPLMENQPYALEMQKDMIRQIETANPAYAVEVYVTYSWLGRPHTDYLILNWMTKYLEEHFELVGRADLLSMNKTEYHWLKPNEPIPESPPRNWVAVYKNKAANAKPAESQSRGEAAR